MILRSFDPQTLKYLNSIDFMNSIFSYINNNKHFSLYQYHIERFDKHRASTRNTRGFIDLGLVSNLCKPIEHQAMGTSAIMSEI